MSRFLSGTVSATCVQHSRTAYPPATYVRSLEHVLYVQYVVHTYSAACNCSSLHCSSLHCSSLHCSSLLCSSIHCSSLHCSSLHCSSLHCSSLHCSSIHCSSLHCSSLVERNICGGQGEDRNWKRYTKERGTYVWCLVQCDVWSGVWSNVMSGLVSGPM